MVQFTISLRLNHGLEFQFDIDNNKCYFVSKSQSTAVECYIDFITIAKTNENSYLSIAILEQYWTYYMRRV